MYIDVEYILSIYIPSLVDVGAVDTFRPKGQRARVLTNDQFVTKSESTAGASGEVVDSSQPILPITPRPIANTKQ